MKERDEVACSFSWPLTQASTRFTVEVQVLDYPISVWIPRITLSQGVIWVSVC